MIKALVIVPYEGLFELMKEIQQEVKDFQFDIELGNLHEGAAIAKAAENKGYHVIISRGGTASLIQKAVSIPVIDIQVSGYDVLRILTLVKGFSRKAAIVGFSNITQGAATICRLLDFDINALTITKETEVKEKLSNLKNLGYEVIMGDVVTVNAAKQLGLTGVLITSGKEAIIDALEEARRAYRIFSRLQKDVSLYQSILDSDTQAIVVFNREEKIVYENDAFNKEFHRINVENSTDIKKLIQVTIFTGEKQTKMVHMNDSFWIITACPKEDAIVLYVEKNLSNRADAQEGEVNPIANAIEFHTAASYIPFSGRSEPIQQVLKQIDEYSKSELPVWISGEAGNGKELAAHSIYLKRKTGNEPFIVIHCEWLKEDLLKDLMTEGFFQKYSNGLFYLKNIHKLNLKLQKEFYHLIKNENQLQWLASSDDMIEEIVKNGTFHRELYNALSQLTIYIPPLRERKEDIEDLVHVLISELHPKYGNEVVGIRAEALAEITKFDWPGNVEQLKQVIEQLFLQTHSYYIEKESVENVLEHFMQPEKRNIQLTPIDISGTLEEIEEQIITKVLEEEGLNQSKAAKRLGINRSTLWRKLKS